jgi:NAD(P)H-nitrite reductase large subunit
MMAPASGNSTGPNCIDTRPAVHRFFQSFVTCNRIIKIRADNIISAVTEIHMAPIKGAITQRDGNTYAVVTRSPAGIVTAEHLEKVAGIARKYRIPTIKITSGQRLALIGIVPEDVAPIRKELGDAAEQAEGPCVKYVQACLGIETCQYGVQDSIGLAGIIEGKFLNRTYPAKIKIGVSGCPRCCGESHIRDIGLMATRKGWTVLFGGNGGTRPRFGDVVAKNLTAGEAEDLVERLLSYYRNEARPHERTARFMERIGTETLRSDLLRFIPYIPVDELKPE